MPEQRYTNDDVAALFDGQGIFQPGMGKQAYDRYGASREVFKQASDAVGVNMGRVWRLDHQLRRP